MHILHRYILKCITTNIFSVCGPNTWQEWSREGRRPYPLLPRISPQTALSIVANDLAAKAYAENSKLPPPNETGANLSEALREQAAYQTLKHGITKHQEPIVVMDEPVSVSALYNLIGGYIHKYLLVLLLPRTYVCANMYEQRKYSLRLGFTWSTVVGSNVKPG